MSLPPCIFVNDATGQPVLRYLVLPDDAYFGGNAFTTDAWPGLDHGPHIFRTWQGMLELFGRLAHEDGHPYTLGGGRIPYTVPLRPEMRADHLADILGIKTQDVIDYYGLMVRVTDHGASDPTSGEQP